MDATQHPTHVFLYIAPRSKRGFFCDTYSIVMRREDYAQMRDANPAVIVDAACMDAGVSGELFNDVVSVDERAFVVAAALEGYAWKLETHDEIGNFWGICYGSSDSEGEAESSGNQ